MTTGSGMVLEPTRRDMAKDENTIRRIGTVTKIHGGTYEIEDEDTKTKFERKFMKTTLSNKKFGGFLKKLEGVTGVKVA